MDLAVLLKPLPRDPSTLDDATGTGPAPDTPQRLNPADQAPLRFAQALAARHDAAVHLVAVGPPQAKTVLEQALTTAGDEAHLATGDALTGGDAWGTAHALEATLRTIGPPDLVLAGTRSHGQGTGQTGPRTAMLLDRPHLPTCTELRVDPDQDRLHASSRTREAEHEITVLLPALATIHPDAEPTLDTLQDRLTHQRLQGAQQRNADAFDEHFTEHTQTTLDVHENLTGWQGSPTLTLDATPIAPASDRDTRELDPDDEDAILEIAHTIAPREDPA